METFEASRARFITPYSIATLTVPVVGLIVAVGAHNVLLLNYVHVITGGTWTGIDLFMGLVMTRVMRGLSPEGRVEIVKKLVPIMLFLMPSLASAGITSGIYLAQWSGILNLQSPMIIAAVIIVMILSIQGFGVIMPNEIRIYLELTKKAPDIEKIVRLGMRNIKLSGSQTIFQIAIIFVMANLRFGIV